MLERFSVRKPFTVLVGVVLVIVLGVVSVMSTSTDLLPAMDLPFSVVFTMQMGATPEQIERDITIPLEGRMSTLSGIENVQSISAEHMSIIILQFIDGTNMDMVSLEIREALDMMILPDAASRPMTIRMNPEMLPIMTAVVHMDGVDVNNLSEFARGELAMALEGVPGVAVVNLMGLVQTQLHVVIRDELIEAVNQNIARAAVMLMLDMMREMREMVSAAEAEFIETRTAELVEGGLSAAAAGSQVEAELPAVSEAITESVTQELMGGFAGAAMAEGMGEGAAMGIPAGMISVDTIAGILTAQDFSMPAGFVTDDDTQYMLRVGDRIDDIEDIKNLLIFDPAAMGLAGVEPVRLSDVADVFVTDDSHTTFTRVNGNPSVMLSVQRQAEFSTADVSQAIRSRMDDLASQHPGLGFVVLMDQGEMIDMVIGSVFNNLILGGVLAILILLVFLRDIRPTLVVAVSIPVSILLAFTLMYFTGVDLNMISMGGLALAVGMLVDNSIVVIENIYRMRSTTGRSAVRAAVSGTTQVSGAIAASSLTTIAVFFPIVFTQGMTRQLFTDLALTIAYSLLASLLIALTVVPAASSALFKNVKNQGREGRLFTRFVDGYEVALRFALRFKWLTLLAATGAFVLTLWLISRQGMEMFPPMEMPQITMTAEMPEGSTFDEAVSVAEILSARVLDIDDIETVGVSVGDGGMMGMVGMGFGGGGDPGTTITMYVLLSDSRTLSNTEIVDQMRDLSESMGLAPSITGADAGLGMLAGDPISIRVEGRELDAMRDTAIALSELIRSVDGAVNVTDMTERAAPELRVIVDRDAAMAHGLTVAQVFMAASGAISAPERTLNMTLNGRGYEVVISDGDFAAPDRAAIENLQIPSAAGDVALADIALVREDAGFVSISRMNRSRFITVSGEIDEGYNVTLVNAEIERLLQDFVPADCCRVVIGGEAEMIAETFADLFLMLALALILIYLIMVAQFQSLLSPFIIMFTIPLAFTGGFVALMIAGMTLSVVAMIGLILLTGVVVNNGIVLISRINQMRWDGMAKRDAIIDAGRKRIRPILMTALTTVFAMSVIAIGIGEGTEIMQPMAVATIGGLLYATAMTLLVVPALYDLMLRNKDITKERLDDD